MDVLKSSSRASLDAGQGLEVVDGIMSFISDGRGKPSKNQRALYVAAIAFAYALWENYVEDLAIELVQTVAPVIDPQRLPSTLVERISEGLTPWQLAVTPGWRQEWVTRATHAAKGDGHKRHGLSMARSEAVVDLYGWLGINPFSGMAASTARIDELVTLRNSVVHTGKIPDDLRKQNVIEWRNFVCELYRNFDKGCRGQVASLLAKPPPAN